jgi:hypothetical protein
MFLCDNATFATNDGGVYIVLLLAFGGIRWSHLTQLAVSISEQVLYSGLPLD